MTSTPGPWNIGSIRQSLGGEPVLAINGPDEKTYAYVLYGDGSNKQHAAAYADARLIAAAPELLEALRMARECIAYCRKVHPDPQAGEGIPVELFIDEAIDKAT